eukprot:358364-Chlamydomonas_euryale.AAC.7
MVKIGVVASTLYDSWLTFLTSTTRPLVRLVLQTFLCNKLKRYLNWLGHCTKHINVGSYRRLQKADGETQNAEFFDPHNKKGMETRNLALEAALVDLDAFLNSEDGQVVIFDATNSTRQRRRKLVRGTDRAGCMAEVWLLLPIRCKGCAAFQPHFSRISAAFQLLWRAIGRQHAATLFALSLCSVGRRSVKVWLPRCACAHPLVLCLVARAEGGPLPRALPVPVHRVPLQRPFHSRIQLQAQDDVQPGLQGHGPRRSTGGFPQAAGQVRGGGGPWLVKRAVWGERFIWGE